MIFEPGKLARGKADGVIWRSSQPVDAARLKAIEEQGGSWIDVLDAGPDQRAA